MMKTKYFLLALLFFPGTNCWPAEVSLKFQISDKNISTVSLSELKELLPTHQIQFLSSYYHKEKKYLAFSIADVLNYAYQTEWKSKEFTDIAFTALDGYESVSSLGRLAQSGGYLAYKDLDVDTGWELVGRKQADPGPFFMVWTGSGQTTANAYPWPWQVKQLNLLRFEDQFPKVVPSGIETDSPVYHGFTVFRNRCIRCHSMDKQGGKIGPDLNAPQSITAYRSKHMILEMIKHASKYRYTEMPDHTDLSDQDLENLYLYFKHQNRESGKPQ